MSYQKVRTSEDRFANLPDFNFQSRYMDLDDGLRMHYLDEGPSDGPVVLLLHGEPTWCYLYRKMIPVLVDAGFRTIAPDFIGFGKSDKLKYKSDYTYQRHIDWMSSFIEQIDLKGITLFCQDWGGLVGLRIVSEMQDRFIAVVAANTTLPTGTIKMPESFMKWREFSQNSPEFNIGKVVDKGTIFDLSADVIAAYEAPFPSEEYKAGARIFPMLVPIEESDQEARNNKLAWRRFSQWEKPFLTIFGDDDPIMRGAEKVFQQIIPGAKGQEHSFVNAGHFLQEDQGPELAKRIITFYKTNFDS